MVLNNFLSDEELIRRLLKIKKRDLKGSNVREMIDGLTAISDRNEKVFLVREICQRYGETRIQTGSSFSASREVFEHFRMRLGSVYQEMFFTLILDNKHRLISEQLITVGTLNQSLVHPREIFAPAIEQRSAAVVLVHNHPSGDPKPSTQDREITKRLADIGHLVGIKVLDHVIIGADTYFSFVDENLMPQ